MKILMIRTSLHGGGAERVVSEISNYICKNGKSVDIYIYDNVIDYEIDPDVNIVLSSMPEFLRKLYTYSLKFLGNFAYFIFSPCFIYYLNKDLNLKKYDKIFIHSLSSILQFMYLNCNQTYNVFHSYKSDLLLKGRGKLSNLKNRLVINLSSRWKKNVAVSYGIAADLKDNFKIKECNVIYNPFDTGNIILKSNSNELDLTTYGKYIISVGRLDKIKNQKELISAFSKVDQKYDSLLLLGSGDLKEELQLFAKSLNIEDKVHFIGFVDNPYEYIRKGNLLVLSSILEGFGNVIVESLIIGTPVISSNCNCGPREILTGKLSSYLYETNNELDLVKKLRKFDYETYPFDNFNINKFHIEKTVNSYLELK
ncbi:glycosyltransferase [Photobacterium iliopiscarium]|uniref:glycosyltransferase n=1 Tax=Photobacterium iliopiscarium TaxID=56192 RepID=UPI000695E79F|nr:glycosyltransferase [Photobacterium iliopiscarium]PSU01216.1 glycosyltransferase [Photobacterium iliopiscarium]PSV83873.1 glycosyltransferase [Photobacterium iliopiscarium]